MGYLAGERPGKEVTLRGEIFLNFFAEYNNIDNHLTGSAVKPPSLRGKEHKVHLLYFSILVLTHLDRNVLLLENLLTGSFLHCI